MPPNRHEQPNNEIRPQVGQKLLIWVTNQQTGLRQRVEGIITNVTRNEITYTRPSTTKHGETTTNTRSIIDFQETVANGTIEIQTTPERQEAPRSPENHLRTKVVEQYAGTIGRGPETYDDSLLELNFNGEPWVVVADGIGGHQDPKAVAQAWNRVLTKASQQGKSFREAVSAFKEYIDQNQSHFGSGDIAFAAYIAC